jgi:hypothetical protein
LRWGLEHV